MKTAQLRRLIAFLLNGTCLLLLISCGSSPSSIENDDGSSAIESGDGPPPESIDVSKVPNAVPKQTSRSRYGNPKSYEVFGKQYYVMATHHNYKERGIASWYGSKFHGRRTSSGEPYDMHGMTAAHKSLPLPTYVKVTNLKNNRQVILKVNDRGPFHEGRIIDLSHTAAVKLGIKATGTGWVEVEAISPGQTNDQTNSQTIISSLAPNNKTSAVALYIQLGAFSNSDNAHQLSERINLLLSSNQAYIIKRINNDQTLYKVRIGPFTDTAQADKQIQLLNEKGVSKHHFIIE